MNFAMLKAFVDRLGVRTKLIGVAVIAFCIGMFFGGRGPGEANGRYVPWGDHLLDTRSGQIYIYDRDSGRIKRGPALPGWF